MLWAMDTVRWQSAGLKRVSLNIFSFHVNICNNFDHYTYFSHYLKYGFEYICRRSK